MGEVGKELLREHIKHKRASEGLDEVPDDLFAKKPRCDVSDGFFFSFSFYPFTPPQKKKDKEEKEKKKKKKKKKKERKKERKKKQKKERKKTSINGWRSFIIIDVLIVLMYFE